MTEASPGQAPVVSEFWRDLWKRELEFLESGKEEFRHNTSFIGVSTIAGQFYCEYKAENEFKFGEIPTEAKVTGTSLHDELMPTEEVSQEEFALMVGGTEPSYGVLRVWGAAGGLKILGMPDHIVWAEGRPLWLVELKTTKGDPIPLWEDQANQVRIYGLLLELMGFDCSRLRLALVRIKAHGLAQEEKKAWIEAVSNSLQEGKVGELESKYNGMMKVHLLEHDRKGAEDAISAKSGYWLGTRDPSSSDSVGKCRACEYNDVCPRSLFNSARTG